MFKEELVRKVARATRLSQRIVSDVLTETLKEVTAALSEGKPVHLLGFGVFEARHRPEGKVKNIRTGEIVTFPARFQPVFRAGEHLKKAVRKVKPSKSKKK